MVATYDSGAIRGRLRGMGRREALSTLFGLLAATGAGMSIGAPAFPADAYPYLVSAGIALCAIGIVGLVWLVITAPKSDAAPKKDGSPTEGNGAIRIGTMGDNSGHIGHKFNYGREPRQLTDDMKIEILRIVNGKRTTVVSIMGDPESDQLGNAIASWLTEIGQPPFARQDRQYMAGTPVGIIFRLGPEITNIPADEQAEVTIIVGRGGLT